MKKIMEVIKRSRHVKGVGVIDKSVSFGNSGPVYSDVKAALKLECNSLYIISLLACLAAISRRKILKKCIGN